MSPPGTIDLGELPSAGRPEPAAPWPVTERFRRWGRTGRPRRLVAVAVATGLLLATTAAAAPPPPAALVARLSVGATQFGLDGRHLYVLDSSRQAGTVEAYRLADGTRRWRTPLPRGGRFGSLVSWEHAVVAMSVAAPVPTAVVLDPDTGEQVWSGPGLPLDVGGGLVLLRHDVLGPGGGPRDPARVLTVVDVAGGRHWTRPEPEGAFAVSDSGRLVSLDAGGRLSTQDLVTGERVATAPDRLPPDTRLRTVHGLALAFVPQRRHGTGSLTAYDVDTLAVRWTVDWDASRSGLSLVPCGKLVCLSGLRAPRAIDPGSGGTVWTADWVPDDGTGWFTVTEPESPQLAGHLLLSRRDGNQQDRVSWLVDAATGEPVAELGGWEVASRWGATGSVPAVLPRHGVGARAWVGRLRPDLSGIEPVAEIASTTFPPCQLREPYLACASAPGGPAPPAVTVWRLRW